MNQEVVPLYKILESLETTISLSSIVNLKFVPDVKYVVENINDRININISEKLVTLARWW